MAQPAEDAPLARGSLAGSEDALILPGGPRGGSNSRALKVAGLTTLACLLLASQVFTAYMMFDQKQQIHSLQKNSDRLGRQLTRSSQAPVKMQRAMNSLPLMMDFALDQDAKTETETPQAKLQDAVVSVEMQLKDLMKDSPLPQFNETFLANLQSLKQHMNESEWQSFDQWMRYWLIFQMAQQTPAPPTAQSATVIKTKCQMEAAPGASKIGAYKPQCDEQGHYKPMQCWAPTGFCWCVDQTGTPIPGTSIRGHPDCRRVHPRRKMFVPMPLQKAFSADEW